MSRGPRAGFCTELCEKLLPSSSLPGGVILVSEKQESWD